MWIHSSRETSGDVLTYRPREYPLPPARGRSGFELRRDGTVLRLDIAPTDGSRGMDGRWESPAPDQLRITYDDGHVEILTIIAVSDDMLRVRVAQGGPS